MQKTLSTSGHKAAGRTISAIAAVGVIKISVTTKKSRSIRHKWTLELSGREIRVLLAKESIALIL